LDVPIAGVLADPFKLAAAAARELAPLRAKAAEVATDLANQAPCGQRPRRRPVTRREAGAPGAAPQAAPEAAPDTAHPPGAEPDALDELLARP